MPPSASDCLRLQFPADVTREVMIMGLMLIVLVEGARRRRLLMAATIFGTILYIFCYIKQTST